MSSIEKNISVLEYKISETQTKIQNFIKFDISDHKIQKLQLMLDKYQSQLEHYKSLQ